MAHRIVTANEIISNRLAIWRDPGQRRKWVKLREQRYFLHRVCGDWHTVAALLKAAPELAAVSDRQGHTAVHRACAIKRGGGPQPIEPNGVKTIKTLLEAGADLEQAVAVAVDEDEDDGYFRATPLWYAVAVEKISHWPSIFYGAAPRPAIRFGQPCGTTMPMSVAHC
ncbi:hypothetical protein E2553_38155 [Paraburkholderia dipogonis]|uniref:Ankyrin repeat domain-containing protein n=1 Tax=Paraburkholderia dipogonis TaxID=1211383 RepID=A0A4Y8MIX2_9BURK|nr:hypothetical protein [Paraburkholderia dipogonis]TFE37323.1 hypothetical protein E2553_38155 [Paraburkholderia dipogonis]